MTTMKMKMKRGVVVVAKFEGVGDVEVGRITGFAGSSTRRT